MASWAIWLITAGALGALEVLSGDFFLLMIAGGAGAAAIAALLGAQLWLQLVVFGIVSILLVLGVRPWANRMLTRNQPEIADGADAVLGTRGVVTQQVDTHGGRIRVGSDEWSALAQLPYETFAPGTKVVIVEVRGAHAVVAQDATTEI